MQKICEKHNCQGRYEGNTENSNSGHGMRTSKSNNVKVQKVFVGVHHSNHRTQ